MTDQETQKKIECSFDLYNGDCLTEMEKIADESVDLIFNDLPYGQVSCDWDKKIDLKKMWEHFMRIKKLRTPIFMCCSTKFGAELIASAPKKCPFRYDIVWVKSAPVGFLSARKMPMKKHEMLYVFYEKLPLYDLSTHTHKFKQRSEKVGDKNSTYGSIDRQKSERRYDPPLPMSVQKEEASKKLDLYGRNHIQDQGLRGSYEPPLPVSVQKEIKSKASGTTYDCKPIHYHDPETGKRLPDNTSRYEPPLPTSVQTEKVYQHGEGQEPIIMGKEWSDKQGGVKVYEPPLPTSVQSEMRPEYKCKSDLYGEIKRPDFKRKNGESAYNPPLPTSVQKEEKKDVYDYARRLANGELKDHRRPMGWRGGAHWEPSLPTSVQKEEKQKIRAGQIYNGGKEMDSAYTPSEKKAIYKMSGNNQCYQPPLPTSVQVESKNIYNNKEITHYAKRKGNESAYEPPLPTSVQKQGTIKPNVYSDIKGGMYRSAPGQWSPPLPTTVQRTETGEYKPYTVKDSTYGKDLKVTTNYKGRKGSESCYDPPLPTSVQSPECPELDDDDTFLLHANQEEHLPAESREDLIRRLINPDMETDYLNEEELPHSVLEIASQKGKHSTQKPLDLMKWALKYYSKEGDVVLDNTMGSGSTGVACKEMNRSFIGIEMNPDIFETACDRILD
jgi:DNA modification methylase